MPSILKRFTKPEVVPYQFPEAEHLTDAPITVFPLDTPEDSSQQPAQWDSTEPPEQAQSGQKHSPPPNHPVEFAQVQAEAILEDAKRQAAMLLAQAKLDVEEELEDLRAKAQQDGYQLGYAEGMTHALGEGQQQRTAQAIALAAEIRSFLDKASHARDEMLEQSRKDLKDLSIAIAEKIIRVSLKSSGEVVAKMIQTATEKMKRKEWVHIYVADCDAKGVSKIATQLTESLSHISDHVRIVPMANDESGTCIIETPDEIIDASASTQLSSIRDILDGG